MRQVAGVLQRDGAVDRAEAAREVLPGDEFEHVAHRRREALRAVRPLLVVAQQVAVLLHRRAAAGGVHDHIADLRLLEGRDVATGEVAGALDVAGVAVQRAAAALRGRRDDLVPEPREHAHRRLVHRGVHLAVYAAGEHRHAPPRRRRRGQRAAAAEGAAGERGRLRLQRTQALGQQTQQGASHEPLQAAAGVEPQQREERAQHARAGDHVAQHERL